MRNKKITFILSVIILIFAGKNLTAQIVKTFNYTGSLQTWTVPCINSVTITAFGAAGGASNYQNLGPYPGGSGAQIIGTFAVVQGNVLDIMVGQKGTIDNEGSGGGGSFVWNSSNSNKLMIAAGGGGGSYSVETGGNGAADSIPTAGAGYDGGSAPGGVGGNGGAGGPCVGSYGAGGGGAGWISNGGTGTSCGGYAGGAGGNTPLSGGAGGLFNVVNSCAKSATGGYGGGGASTCYGGGGGGGYNGGGGATGFNTGWNAGGGGGSYNIGTNQSGFAGIDTGNGLVVIAYFTDTVGSVTGHLISGVSCFGQNNGMASGIVIGSSPVYTYAWTPRGGTRDTATGLSVGTYTITVHDPCGHSVSSSVTVTQPASALSATASVTSNVSCNGGQNGTLTATAKGGTSPYTYLWTPSNETNSVALGLTAGTYTLNVTDNHGCTASATATITQPKAVTISANTTANVLCNGGSTGSATSKISGGVSAYTYLWMPAGESTNTATGLSAGSYTVTVIDSCGGSASASVIITQPNPLNVSIDSINNVRCNGDNTGSALSNVSGGVSPYTYLWTNKETSALATGLSAGTYTLGVADANGCTNTASVIITQPTAISMTSSMKPDDGTHDGSARVSVSGGISPYTYLWNPGGSTTDSISHDSAGTYCCHITDAHRCKDSVCVTIQSTAGVNSIESGIGQITVYPNPNTGQFTLSFSHPELVSGTQTIEVYNALGARVYNVMLNQVQHDYEINLSSQPNGIYLYRIIKSENGNLLGEGKLVIEK